MGPGLSPENEYYNDWLKPQDEAFHLIGGTVLNEGSWSFLFCAVRPQRVGPWRPDEVALVSALIPHVQRVIQVQRRLEGLEGFRDAANAAFDRLNLGVILVNGHGRPILINRRAQEILDEHDGLAADRNGLRAARLADTQALARLVREATHAAAFPGGPAGGAVALSRPSLRRPLEVLVAPLPAGHCRLFKDAAAAAVFVSDPERAVERPLELLRRLYGLTEAEARLATVILEGRSLGDAADRLGVGLETARSQLKAVFQKTDTHRQSDLVRLVLSSPAALRVP